MAMELTIYQTINGFNDFNPFPNDKFYTFFQTERVCSFECDEKGRKFSKWVENTVGKKRRKLHVASNFSFSVSVFKRLVLQTRKNQGLFGKELRKKPSENIMNGNCKIIVARKVLCCLSLQPPCNKRTHFK